jgi:hypothetical protein
LYAISLARDYCHNDEQMCTDIYAEMFLNKRLTAALCSGGFYADIKKAARRPLLTE